MDYSVTNYLEKVKEHFDFLISEHHFKLEMEDQGLIYKVEFKRDELKLLLNYDIRDNFFYFFIIKGIDTIYPNDNDNKNIVPFYRFFQECNIPVKKSALQPDNFQFEKSLKLNADILKSKIKLLIEQN